MVVHHPLAYANVMDVTASSIIYVILNGVRPMAMKKSCCGIVPGMTNLLPSQLPHLLQLQPLHHQQMNMAQLSPTIPQMH
jgi:hypothetical protein